MHDIWFNAFELPIFVSFQYECKGIPSGPRNTGSMFPFCLGPKLTEEEKQT